jgi:hypothetical protein
VRLFQPQTESVTKVTFIQLWTGWGREISSDQKVGLSTSRKPLNKTKRIYLIPSSSTIEPDDILQQGALPQLANGCATTRSENLCLSSEILCPNDSYKPFITASQPIVAGSIAQPKRGAGRPGIRQRRSPSPKIIY